MFGQLERSFHALELIRDAGTGSSGAGTRAISAQLFGVTPIDFATYADVAGLAVTLSIIRRHLDPTAPSGPPGLTSSRIGSAEPPERAEPPLPTTARVTLRFARTTVAEAFQQIAIQAPGVVWTVFENRSVSSQPRCSVGLYYPGGSLVTGFDVLK